MVFSYLFIYVFILWLSHLNKPHLCAADLGAWLMKGSSKHLDGIKILANTYIHLP